jgi:ribosomal protein S18 acetylase RimI-like enzyme
VTVRDATAADLPRLNELYRAFLDEVPPPEWVDVDVEQELREVADYVQGKIAVVAEENGAVVGFALARREGARELFLPDLYVAPEARRSGLAAQLMAAVAAHAEGAEEMTLDVRAANTAARSFYERLGFRTEALRLHAPVAALAARPAVDGPSYGSVHVQTDDRLAAEQLVAKYLPRIGRTAGSEVTEPRNGWVAVYADLVDRDHEARERLARELSYGSGAVTLAFGVERGAVVRYTLYEAGRSVDEYLSVPEFYESLPPGIVVSLRANPTVVSRLTGADPAQVRAVAQTGATPAELPPAPELAVQIAAVMGIEGVDRGWLGSHA